MKVIISHDVDHISIWEHKKSLIIPKFIIRTFLELSIGTISLTEIWNRFLDFLKNRWHNLEDLVNFNKKERIPATFFFGVNNGMGLEYSLKDAIYWIYYTIKNGFEVGVHGIEYQNFSIMKKEFEVFKKITKLSKFGIRMHYLRVNEDTLQKLNKLGYLYDSSIYSLRGPYKVGNMYEFPLHIMDGFIFYGKKRYKINNLRKAIEETKRIVEEAYNKNVGYFTILFHDRYFSKSFKDFRDWYLWLIDFLKTNKFKFVDYKTAIKELEGKQ